MIERPRTKAHLDVVSVDGDKLFVIDGTRQLVLEGPVAARVGTLLDGSRELGDIVVDAGGSTSIPEVLRTIGTFEGLGCLADGPFEGPREEAAFWDSVGVAPASGAEALARPVELHLGEGVPAQVCSALEAAGLVIAPAAGDVSTASTDSPALALVVVTDYLDPALRELCDRFHAAGTPWIIAKVTGTELWVGPFVQPGSTACWTCLAERLEGNRQLERYLAAKLGSGAATRIAGSPAAIAPTIALGAGLIAAEVAQTQAASTTGDGAEPNLANTLLTFDLRTLASERHAVVRQPGCATCGDPQLLASRDPRVELTPRPKAHTSAGGHRVEAPEVTYERLIHHVSPVTGAVSSLKRQTADDNGVTYSFSSGHNFAMMKDDLYFLRRNLRGRSGGKGRTEIQAKVGSICEAIERFNGVWRDVDPTVHATRAELGDRAVDVQQLFQYSEQQYAGRHAWNAAQKSSYHLVPAPFEDDRPINWTRCWSLTYDREVLVPSGFSWFGHPDMNDHWICGSDANGNAAGNTIEEAALQGLMELVERDSVALWWYTRSMRPAFDMDSLDEPYVDLVREHYAKLGREIWMLDITSDIGIPVFAAISYRTDGPTQDILLGFGAHIDVKTAALRALTELNQFLPAVVDVAADGTAEYRFDDPDAIDWWQTATLESDPYVRPAEHLAPTTVASFDEIATDCLAEDVRRVVDLLAERGLETVILDQSRPDIDLATVKMMVPGLRHFWRRLGEGRLYEVPEALGWTDGPVVEADLNPRSIFF